MIFAYGSQINQIHCYQFSHSRMKTSLLDHEPNNQNENSYNSTHSNKSNRSVWCLGL